MRLHTALEHLKSGHYRSMEPWKANEIDEMARHVEACAASAAEFTFSFLDADPKDDTLQTFIDFANELWDAEVAPIPHDVFWVSWVQKVLDEHVHMAALCEKNMSPIDGKLVSLSVRVMFENHRRNGLVFLNQVGQSLRRSQARPCQPRRQRFDATARGHRLWCVSGADRRPCHSASHPSGRACPGALEQAALAEEKAAYWPNDRDRCPRQPTGITKQEGRGRLDRKTTLAKRSYSPSG